MMADPGTFQFVKDKDGRMTVNALPYADEGWRLLRLIATSHEDGFVRITAAETMIRLGQEFAPNTRGFYDFAYNRIHVHADDPQTVAERVISEINRQGQLS